MDNLSAQVQYLRELLEKSRNQRVKDVQRISELTEELELAKAFNRGIEARLELKELQICDYEQELKLLDGVGTNQGPVIEMLRSKIKSLRFDCSNLSVAILAKDDEYRRSTIKMGELQLFLASIEPQGKDRRPNVCVTAGRVDTAAMNLALRCNLDDAMSEMQVMNAAFQLRCDEYRSEVSSLRSAIEERDRQLQRLQDVEGTSLVMQSQLLSCLSGFVKRRSALHVQLVTHFNPIRGSTSGEVGTSERNNSIRDDDDDASSKHFSRHTSFMDCLREDSVGQGSLRGTNNRRGSSVASNQAINGSDGFDLSPSSNVSPALDIDTAFLFNNDLESVSWKSPTPASNYGRSPEAKTSRKLSMSSASLESIAAPKSNPLSSGRRKSIKLTNRMALDCVESEGGSPDASRPNEDV